MKLNELKNDLETLNIPVAYNFFKEEQTLPYIVILSDGEESGGSDYGNELIRRVFIIELYSVQKDESLEDKLEKLLTEMAVKWIKYETYIDDEDMYQCAYHIEFYEKRS